MSEALTAASRSRTYWLVSELYLGRPTGASLKDLREHLDGLAREAGEEFPAEWAALRDGLDADSAHALAVEHTRLFGGLHASNGPAPPYESVHRESQLLGDTTFAVVRAYADAGFGAIFPQAGPQDHLGVELRFMALAAHEEMQAWTSEERAAAADLLECQLSFLETHLLAWAPAYGQSLVSKARAPFYAALGALTERILVDDHDLMRALLAGLAA